MAWSPRILGGNKKPRTKLGNFKNKAEGGDELQESTPIVNRISLEVTTNTQVATTLVGVVLESNHPFLDASSSFLGNGREV